MIMQKTNKEKGDDYEKYVVDFLKSEYDNIWLWKNVPESILIENNIINNYNIYSDTRRDIGIDIVAVKDGIYEYIQCKNYADNVCLNDISGFLFFMILNNVNGTLCYSNGISQNIINLIKDKENISKLKINLRHIPFKETDDMINVVTKFQVRYYQQEAIEIMERDENIKTILTMPCGTGKTFTVSRIAKKYHNVIVLSPLRKLTSDLLATMSIFLGKSYKKILLSSEGIRNITDIKKVIGIKNIIGCTYDSVDVLNKIFDELNDPIIIIDEYHNLSYNNLHNKKDNIYKLLQNDCKTIYMSATPNLSINHDAIYKYDWDKAIDDKYICDFNITVPSVDIIDNDNLNKMLELLKDISVVNEKMIKKAYFIVKSLLYNGNQKCIIYLTTVEKANIFKNVSEGLMKLLNIEISINVVTNKTNKKNREISINTFKNSCLLSILLNVHILDEGIDIPECDSVFITQPNNNIANLIQRMCRCNRMTSTKKTCNMYIWCTEKKTQKILDYIRENTSDAITGKVNKYDSINNKKIEKKKIIKVIKKNIQINNSLKENIKVCNNTDQFIEQIKILSQSSDTYCIDLDLIADWLGAKIENLIDTLKRNYIEKDDYIVKLGVKPKVKNIGGSEKKSYYVTLECFKLLASRSNAKNANNIRKKLIKTGELVNYYKDEIL